MSSGIVTAERPQLRLNSLWLILAQIARLAIVGFCLVIFLVAVRIFIATVDEGFVGATVARDESGQLYFTGVLPDMAAAQLGIQPGDKLVAIDGVFIDDSLSFEQAVSLADGPVGSEMRIAVQSGDGPVRDYVLIRPVSALAHFMDQIGLPTGFFTVYILAFDFLTFAAYMIVSALLFWRMRRDATVILTTVALVSTGLTITDSFLTLSRVAPNWDWATTTLVAVGYACAFGQFYVFPDGRFVPRWSRLLVAGLMVWAALQFVWPPARLYRWPVIPREIFVLLLMGLGLAAQLYRYRRVSTPVQRQQTKWIVLGFSACVIGMAIAFIPRSVIPILMKPGVPLLLFRLLVYQPFFFIPFILLPISYGFSFLRYRLWDVDFVINRSLVYGALTVVLAAIFSLTVYVASLFIGQSLPAFALAVAVAGLTFQPIRVRLQRFVDRRFYNIHIDYARSRPQLPTRFDSNIDRYSNLQLIGRGGMADVYRADDSKGRPVALKLLHPTLAEEPEFRLRFQREARIIAQLQHPNIVRVIDSGSAGGTLYLVVDYIGGADLKTYLHGRGPLTLTEALPILQDVASALDCAHAQGLVHRDIKPSNVLLDKKAQRPGLAAQPPSAYRAVLTDFGIAKIAETFPGSTKTGVIGTFEYIAPEQIQASTEVDGRADVYSLGVMTYQMLTGELPFRQSNPGALLIAHLTQPPPDPRQASPSLSPACAAAIQRALAKTPTERFPSAGEFIAALL